MTNGLGVSLLLVAGISVGVFAGCGSQNTTAVEISPPAGIEIVAEDSEDWRVGNGLREYMVRNCPATDAEMPPMREKWGPRMRKFMARHFEAMKRVCSSGRSIEVTDGQITLTSGLEGDDLKDAGWAFCNLVRGSDVADMTPGHEILDDAGDQIMNCGTHNAYR